MALKTGRVKFNGSWPVLILLMVIFFPIGIIYLTCKSEIQFEET